MAEKKVMEEICPCGGHRAEFWADVEKKTMRLDFVSVETTKEPEPKKPDTDPFWKLFT